jgi:hypothetical protein
MKQLFAFVLVAVSAVVLMNACQKEVSFEGGGTPSEGLLQSDVSGDCLPKTVNGTYEAGTALNGATNNIQVTVEVTTPGSYTIYTDTVNGVFFRASGIFTATGANSVTLRGSGTPATDGNFNFLVQYNGQTCSVPITFLPTGAGGPATFAINGTPNPCTTVFYTVNGSYGAGLPLNGSNTVTISVNVTAIGSYTISTTATNGMTFAAQGAFLNTGVQTVTLNGSGIPTAAATSTIPITAGSSTCSFPVTVTGAAVYTVDCSTANPAGTYEEGTALDVTNTVTLTVNATTAGTYSITTAAVNGMTFTGSGTLTVGSNTITLTGSGTPVADGDFDITIAGPPSCTFQLVVDPGAGPGPATIDWKFTEGIVHQGPFVSATLTVSPLPPIGNVALLLYDGETVTGDTLFYLDIFDINATITAGETYNSNAAAANGMAFYVENAAGDVLYEADPSVAGVNIVLTVTTHNTATKFIEGTFSGTAKDGAGVTKTITLGTFRGTYQ